MNPSASNMIFPQLVLRNARAQAAAPRFRGVLLPAEPKALNAFYRALPCVGEVVRETCEKQPEAMTDKVLHFALATLREYAPALAQTVPEELEDYFYTILRRRVDNIYAEASPVTSTETGVRNQNTATNEPAERRRVLVAGNDPVTRFLVCADLQATGAEPYVAENGPEVLLMTALVQPAQVLFNSRLDGVEDEQVQAILETSKFSGNPTVTFQYGANKTAAAEPVVAFRATLANAPTARTPAATPFSLSAAMETFTGIELHREPTDLSKVLHLVFWIFGPLAKRQGVKLQLDAPESGLVAACDGQRMQSALENLLSDAIKNAAPQATITLAARTEGRRLVFSVNTDRQIAATASLKARDAEDSPESAREICEHIVAAHGGKMRVNHDRRNGAHVEFELPALLSYPVSAPVEWPGKFTTLRPQLAQAS